MGVKKWHKYLFLYLFCFISVMFFNTFVVLAEGSTENDFDIVLGTSYINNIDGGELLFELDNSSISDGAEVSVVSVSGPDSLVVYDGVDGSNVEVEATSFVSGKSVVKLKILDVSTNEDALLSGVYKIDFSIVETIDNAGESTINTYSGESSFVLYDKVNLGVVSPIYAKKDSPIIVASNFTQKPLLITENDFIFSYSEDNIVLEMNESNLDDYVGDYSLTFVNSSDYEMGVLNFTIDKYVSVESIDFVKETQEVLYDENLSIDFLNYVVNDGLEAPTENDLSWQTSDSSVAVVEENKIKVVGVGTTNVVLCSSYSEVCSSYALVVKNPQIVLQTPQIVVNDEIKDSTNVIYNYSGGNIEIPYFVNDLISNDLDISISKEFTEENLAIEAKIENSFLKIKIPALSEGKKVPSDSYTVCLTGKYSLNGVANDISDCYSFDVNDYVPTRSVEFETYSAYTMMNQGDTYSLPNLVIESALSGQNVTFDNYVYTSSNVDVASVTTNGIVTLGDTEGRTVITATSTKENVSAQFVLYVAEDKNMSFDIEDEVDKSDYIVSGYESDIVLSFSKPLVDAVYYIKDINGDLVTEEMKVEKDARSLNVSISSNLVAGNYTIVVVNKHEIFMENKDGTKQVVELDRDSEEYEFVVESPIVGITTNEGHKMVLDTSYNVSFAFEPVNVYSDKVLFESSNPEVVSINDEGLITAHSKGEAIITIKAAYQNDILATMKVISLNPSGTLGELTLKNQMLNEGFDNIDDSKIYFGHEGNVRGSFDFKDIDEFEFEVLYNDVKTDVLTVEPIYESGSIDGEFSIDLKGNEPVGEYCIKGIGTISDNDNYVLETNLRCFSIEPFQEIDTISIYKNNVQVGIETVNLNSEDFSLEARLNEGGEPATYDNVIWSSSDDDVAEVNGDGTVSIRGRGTTVITATSNTQNDKSASYTLKVVETKVSLSDFNISPDNSTYVNVSNDNFYVGASGVVSVNYSFQDADTKEIALYRNDEKVIGDFVTEDELLDQGLISWTMSSLAKEGDYCLRAKASYGDISSDEVVDDYCFSVLPIVIPNTMELVKDKNVIVKKDANTLSVTSQFDVSFDDITFKDMTWEIYKKNSDSDKVKLNEYKTEDEDSFLFTINEVGIYEINACLDKATSLCATTEIRVIETSISLNSMEAIGNNNSSLYNVANGPIYRGVDGSVNGSFVVADASDYSIYLESDSEFIAPDIELNNGSFSFNTKNLAAGEYCVVGKAVYEEAGEVLDEDYYRDDSMCFVVNDLVVPQKIEIVTEEEIVPFDNEDGTMDISLKLEFYDSNNERIDYDDITFKGILWETQEIDGISLNGSVADEVVATVSKTGVYTINAFMKQGIKLGASLSIKVINPSVLLSVTSKVGDNSNLYNMEGDTSIYHVRTDDGESLALEVTGIVSGNYLFEDVTQKKIYVDGAPADFIVDVDEENNEFSFDATSLDAGRYCVVAEGFYEDNGNVIGEEVKLEDDSNCFEVKELVVPSSVSIERTEYNKYWYLNKDEELELKAIIGDVSYPQLGWNIKSGSADIVFDENDVNNHSVVLTNGQRGEITLEVCTLKGVNLCDSIDIKVIKSEILLDDFVIRGNQKYGKNILYDVYGGSVTVSYQLKDIMIDTLKKEVRLDSVDGELVDVDVDLLVGDKVKVNFPNDIDVGTYCVVLSGNYMLSGNEVDYAVSSSCFEIKEFVPVSTFEFVKPEQMVGVESNNSLDFVINDDASFKDYVVYSSSDNDILEVTAVGDMIAKKRGVVDVTATLDKQTVSKKVTVVDAEGDIRIDRIEGNREENTNLIYDIGEGIVTGVLSNQDTNKDYIKIFRDRDLTNEVTDLFDVSKDVLDFSINVSSGMMAGKYYVAYYTEYWDDEDLLSNSVKVLEFEISTFINPTSISLSETNILRAFGETFELVATVGPENVSNPYVDWKIDDESVVKLISNEGASALFQVVGRGNTSIHASSQIDVTVNVECVVKTIKAEMKIGNLEIISNDANKGNEHLFYETGGKLKTIVDIVDISEYEFYVVDENDNVVPEIIASSQKGDTSIEVVFDIPASVAIGKYKIVAKGFYSVDGVTTSTIVEKEFLVEEFIPYIDILEGSPYSLENDYSDTSDNYILNVKAKTSYGDFLKRLNLEGTTQELYKNGALFKDDFIATGVKLNVNLYGNVQKYIIIVTGDCNGDGIISALDYIMVRSHIMGNRITDVSLLKGADGTKDGNISALDYIYIRNIIMNGGN